MKLDHPLSKDSKVTIKEWIDNMTYTDLLKGWRFTPAGNEVFQGESGDYWAAKMMQYKIDHPDEAVMVSKQVGWGK